MNVRLIKNVTFSINISTTWFINACCTLRCRAYIGIYLAGMQEYFIYLFTYLHVCTHP